MTNTRANPSWRRALFGLMIHVPSIALSLSAVRQMMMVAGAYGGGGCSWHPGRRERGCWRRQKQRLCWKGKSLFRSAFHSLVGPLPWKHSWKTSFDMCYCNWLRTSSTTPLASVMKTASSESHSGNHRSEDSVSSPWKKGGCGHWENSYHWTPHNPGETGNSLSWLSYLS